MKQYQFILWDHDKGHKGTVLSCRKVKIKRTQQNRPSVLMENEEPVVYGHTALAKKSGTSYYYYLYNAHGDVTAIVDETGNILNSYEYTPWGEISAQTETVENDIKYAGEYYDEETGLIYLRNRYYDPSVRRFTSEDPARDDLNWYCYCGNNPVNFVDPWGLTYLIAWSYAKDDLKWYKDLKGNIDWDKFTKESSFARAAYTQKEELLKMGVPEEEIDIQRIDSGDDLEKTWDMWSNYSEVDALFFYSHGDSTDGAVVAGGTPSNFWINAKKLNWSEEYDNYKYGSFAAFFGCNTAKGNFAQKFANSQNIRVFAQKGKAVFSRNRNELRLINDSGPVYLNYFEEKDMSVKFANLINYKGAFGVNTNGFGTIFIPE